MNKKRAAWALQGVKRFARATGIEEECLETQVGDFVADLMHLCKQNKTDFEIALERGRNHFEEEYDGTEL